MRKSSYTYRALVSILFCCLLVACSKTPDGVLKEKKMQYVQRDMVFAEGLISQNPNEYNTPEKKQALYDAVFRKHNITEAVYDSSLMWYGRNLDVYMKVIDRISEDLKKIESDVNDEIKNAPQGPSRTDSIDIWPLRRNYNFTARNGGNRLAFDIKPVSNYPSGSSFVMAAKVYGVSSEMAYPPVIKLSAEQNDTIITVRDTVKEDGIIKLILKTVPTMQVKRVFGDIHISGLDTIDYKIIMDSVNIFRYNYGKLDMDKPAVEEEKPIDEPEVQ